MENTAVIVPVLGRPDNAAPFMDSFDSSGAAETATVYAVADEEDDATANAWSDAGAEVLNFPSQHRGGAGTFAEKVNFGYENTEEPWLFLTGDDVKFYRDWLDYAQAATRAGYDVIGTNDMHNSRVVTGEHATHMLVRRSYVDERGASWDGPGVVAHEGYGHWYVDDEIVTVAKQRRTFISVRVSLVEHLHPAWSLAKDDAVYRLGESRVDADAKLWNERREKYS
jgi:hypothetical protein